MSVTATAKATPEKGAIRSVTITKAENGFTVECNRESVRGGKDEPMLWNPPNPAVFENLAGAESYIRAGIRSEEQRGKKRKDGDEY